QDDHRGSCQAQFFADNRKYHVILCLRKKPQLLYTVSESSPEQASASDRIKSLERLVAFLVLLRVPPDRQTLKPIALQRQKDRHESDPCRPHPDKLGVLRASRKNDDHREPQDDD